jgi:hypothetical protein
MQAAKRHRDDYDQEIGYQVGDFSRRVDSPRGYLANVDDVEYTASYEHPKNGSYTS